MKRELYCKRCEHNWEPRIKRKPKQCPRCRSPYWDKPRQSKIIADLLKSFEK